MTRYAKRVDSNHAEIRDVCRAELGKDNVVDTSRYGAPFGDLMLKYGGVMLGLETKTEKGKLTDAQKRQKLPMKVVRTPEEARGACRLVVRWHAAICKDAVNFNVVKTGETK